MTNRREPSCLPTENVLDIDAIDISENIIKEAQKNYPHINFKSGIIADVEKSYDLVFACEVLEHIEDYKKALKNIFAVSKKFVFVSVPNEPLWRILNVVRFKYLKDFGNTPGHINHFSKDGIVNLLKEYGNIKKVLSPFPWSFILCEKVYI